ncbi:hypothetical protein AMECASPLE_000904 [Ameca splendens]|uniref:Uncharacterized protein n=1 Tax=Ameca splendens TaxID=208324 RepID=A0ABV0XXX8_9TELE
MRLIEHLKVKFRDVFPPGILVVEWRPEEIWKEFGSQMVESVYLCGGGLNLCGGADFFLDNLHPLLNVQTGPAGAPEFSPIL